MAGTWALDGSAPASGGRWLGAAGCESTGQVEVLTERERDVLRFLPSRLTITEIANELYVSVNTRKFRLKIIYRKLGVSSCAEASEIARAAASVHRTP